MEYGSAYVRASRNPADTILMLSPPEPTQGQYHAYHPTHNRNSSSLSIPQRASWAVSPVDLQQSLPPGPPAATPSPNMRPSIFGSRAVLDSPYQENIAWANSTQFRTSSAEVDEPKPEIQFSTLYGVPEESQPRETRQYFRHPRHILEPWKPGFWVRFPWWGFGALFLVVMFTGVSAGILLASDGMTQADWKVGADNAQPNVYISVLEMIMNFLILFALADGVVIRFWRQLLHGTTLSSIHDTYDSASLWPAIKRLVRLRFNSAAVASLLAALSFIRGPLFQRALTLSTPTPNDPTPQTYHASHILVAFGVVVSLLGVTAIIPLYTGFWEFGRAVSLNPLEVARAFGAPLMDGLDGNATPDMVMVERGGMAVRYGVLERYGEEKKLRVEESSRVTVRAPWEGEIFG